MTNVKQTLNCEAAALAAYLEVLEPLENSHDEGAEADAGFDAGEWSGPAHEQMLEKATQELLQTIATRFGLTLERMQELAHAAENADFICDGMLFTRSEAERMIWNNTQHNLRDVLPDGERCVLFDMGAKGTCRIPLAQLNDEQIVERLTLAVRREPPKAPAQPTRPLFIGFDTREYELAHGKAPRGEGSWAFYFSGSGEPWFAPANLPYGEAKKAAKAEALRRDYSAFSSVTIKVGS